MTMRTLRCDHSCTVACCQDDGDNAHDDVVIVTLPMMRMMMMTMIHYISHRCKNDPAQYPSTAITLTTNTEIPYLTIMYRRWPTTIGVVLPFH